MSAKVLHICEPLDGFDARVGEAGAAVPKVPALPECSGFAREQIRQLVRQVFCPGWPRPARQVVISAVDPGSDIHDICIQVGAALAGQIQGDVCLLDGDRLRAESEKSFGRSTSDPVCGQVRQGSLRESSRQIGERLWEAVLSPGNQEAGDGVPVSWLRDRLAEWRHDFEYTVLRAPSAGVSGAAALLGSLSDGVILVLEANSTRRMAARKVKESLQVANARLLGTVLCDRTFPIPERIYRRL